MLIKIASLFLIAMAVLALFGRLRFGKSRIRGSVKGKALSKPQTCPQCGRHRIGSGVCPCGAPPKSKG